MAKILIELHDIDLQHIVKDDIDPVTVRQAIDAIRKGIILSSYDACIVDYENRLKADMAAMLTEIQLEIKKTYLLDLSDENNVDDYEDFAHNRLVEGIISLIQQKVRNK